MCCTWPVAEAFSSPVSISDTGTSNLSQTEAAVGRVTVTGRDLLQERAVPLSHIAHAGTARAAQAVFSGMHPEVQAGVDFGGLVPTFSFVDW